MSLFWETHAPCAVKLWQMLHRPPFLKMVEAQNLVPRVRHLRGREESRVQPAASAMQCFMVGFVVGCGSRAEEEVAS